MTRKELLHRITEAAEPLSGKREAVAIAYLAAESLFGLERKDFLLDPSERVVASDQEMRRLEGVIRDLEHGCPVQYALGEAWFSGSKFRVTPDVLIPRPETEELVAWVVADHSGMKGLYLCDVCTGSGCIAVSLAKSLPGSRVEATDISEQALEIARENAVANGVEVDFYRADALQLDSQYAALHAGSVDAIVSNPPYIPDSDRSGVELRVAEHEPSVALFVDERDPLVFYRAIAQTALTRLKRGGLLYFEIYEFFSERTDGLLRDLGYEDIVCREDINGKPRMVRCRKP